MPPPADPVRLREDVERIPRVLIIRLRSLGDSILILPFLEALHEWRVDLRIDVAVEATFADVFRNHPAIHELLILKSRDSCTAGWNRARAAIEIRKRGYPLVLNLHGGTTSAILARCSGARMRIGQQGYRNTWAYNALIPQSSELWNKTGLHTVEHQLSFMRWLDLPIPAEPRGTLYLDAEAARRVRTRLQGAGISEYVLIQPTATLATKQWHPGHFGRLADLLAQRHSLPVIVTAGPSEGQILIDVAAATSRSHHYWTDLSLSELFALIAGARLFVGNDSGPTHAAAALRKRVVVVWGSSNYAAWHPWATEFESVGSNLPCMPCPGYTCAVYGAPRCILDVQLERVLEACNRMLAKAEESSSIER